MKEKTGYQFSVSINEGIIEIVITGEAIKKDVDLLHTEIIDLLKVKDAKAALCDISALKGRFDEFAEAFFRVRTIPNDLKRLPSAVVDVSDNKAFQSFYETTSHNVGLLVKWFTDIETARAWLKSKI